VARELTKLIPQSGVVLPQIRARSRIDGQMDFEERGAIASERSTAADALIAILDGADSDSGNFVEAAMPMLAAKPLWGADDSVPPRTAA